MQRFGRPLLALLGMLQLAFLMCALVKPAQAYADPGSGLLLIQIASSMVAGAIFFLRTRLRKLFRLGKPEEPEENLDGVQEQQ